MRIRHFPGPNGASAIAATKAKPAPTINPGDALRSLDAPVARRR